MGNLIDRELLIKKLDEHCNTVCQYPKSIRDVMCDGCPLGTAFDVIDAMPTADLVLCKDCQHYDLFNNGTNGMCMKHIDAMAVFYPWDFCSYGEGKTDERSY